MQGQLEAAAAAYRQAVTIRPDYAEAHNNLGVALERLGQFEAAVESCRRAIALKPNYIEGYNALGVALQRLGHFEEAVNCLRHVVEQRPNFVEAQSNLAAVLEKLGQTDEAITLLERAIALRPDIVGAHVNLGRAYERQGRLSPAEDSFQRALTLDPKCTDAQLNVGLLQVRQGQISKGEQAFRQALAIDPNCAAANLNLGLNLLQQGRLAEGWPFYRWRARVENQPTPSFEQPQWDGFSLAGKTILVCEDQGAGDNIHFIRYAAQLEAQQARVLVRCRQQLMRLFARCPGVHQVYSLSDSLPPFDVYVLMSDIPGDLGTTLENIPARVPYLFPDESLVRQWSERWREVRELKVGLAWQGDPRNKADRYRSIPYEHIAKLSQTSGVRFFSLQFGSGREQLQSGDSAICDLGEELGDFHDTAAIVKNMDLVITCDSAPAHLAGGLGVPVWVALSWTADWRWLLERSDSPWYPTMRLFRQENLGDWGEVFEQIRTELAAWVRRRAERVSQS